jgi:hypothetical protein
MASSKYLNFGKYGKYLTSAIIILYLFMATIFLLYFVVVNLSIFILYSFLLFVALGIIFSYKEKLVEYLILISIILIFSASTAYFMNAWMYAPYSIIAFIVFIFILLVHKSIETRHMLAIFTAIILPIVFYATNFFKFPDYLINVAIIGYYSLIAAVIAIFISMLAHNWELNIGKRISNTINRHSTIFKVIAIALPIILILTPIYIVNESTQVITYTNRTVPYLVYVNSSSNYSTAVSVQPYYMPIVICPPGANTTATIHIQSESAASFFLLNGSTNYSSATVSSGAPTYLYYNSSFSKYSYAKALAIKNTTIKSWISDSCTYLVVLSPNATKVSLKANYTYTKQVEKFRMVKVPVATTTNVTHGFLPSSFGYILQIYENNTNSSAKS